MYQSKFSVAASAKSIVICILAAGSIAFAEKSLSENLITNGDFLQAKSGHLPEGWTRHSARESLAAVFDIVEHHGKTALMATGGGNPDCVSHIETNVKVTGGKTYLFEVLFRKSRRINPQDNLLFQCYFPGAKDGIFEFKRLDDGFIKGSAKIRCPGKGDVEGSIRILFRYSAGGKIWVNNVSLRETDPVKPRWVKVACTWGAPDNDKNRAVLEAAGKANVDIVLLTEYAAGGYKPESMPEGPTAALMSRMARKHKMYVAGGIVRKVDNPDRHYNTALLYDRQGKLIGMYDKMHPYSPEAIDSGITPGTKTPVFETDFGTVGIIICYDSWFPDVTQLLALKGAEIILFPNMGHQPEFLNARAGDNCVRIVNSAWNLKYSIHDTLGRSILDSESFETSPSPNMQTFKDISEIEAAGLKVLIASLDLNCSPSPAYNGGTMMSAPGNRRNRFDMKHYLEDEIKAERERWWVE